MKFSVNWLREFVDLPENPEEIADLLTRAGVEIENIETRGAKIDKVIVSPDHRIVATSECRSSERLRSRRRQRHETPDRLRRDELQSRRQSSARVARREAAERTGDSKKQTARYRIGRNALQPNRARARRRRIRAVDFVAGCERSARRLPIFFRATPFSTSRSRQTVAIC